MKEKQTILALGAGSITKRVFPDGRIERCDNVKDVGLYIEQIDEMIERKYTKVRMSMNPDKKVRRVQGLLYTSGVGVILFSIWAGLRGIESLFELWNELCREYGAELDNAVIKIMICLFVFTFLMFFTFMHVYIGKAAIDVSSGKKKGNMYLVLSVLLSIIYWSLYIFQFAYGEKFEVKTLVYIIIDLTFNIILIEVVVFSLLLKKMR